MVYNSVALSRFTVWYSHHHHPSAWLFITPNKLCTLKDNSPLPLPTAPGCLCSAHLSLWIWAESHSICLFVSGFFHLAQRLQGVSVSRHESAFLSSLVSMVMSPCTCRPRFVYPVISCERLSCFHLLALVINALLNIGLQISVHIPAFSSFGYLSRSGFAGLYGHSVFNF